MKTTCRKSQPANLLQVSNLTFGPSFKVKRVNLLKRPFISFIIHSRTLKCENNLLEAMVFESFASVEFDL